MIADRWVERGLVPDQGDGRLHRSAVPLADLVTAGVRGAMALLAAAVLAMLLLAAANVAALVMIGADARRHDMAVRAALGASRARLVRQLAVEHGVLALAGGVAGLGLAAAGIRAVLALGPATLPRASDLALDWWALALLAGATAAAGAACGVLPVLRLSRAQAASLADATRGSAARPRQRMRQALVVVQVAASVMLLLGATLLVRTLVSLQAWTSVFAPRACSPPRCSCRPRPTRRRPTSSASTAASPTSLPSCRVYSAAGAVRVLPLSRTIGDWSIRLEGRPYSPAENPNADFQAVTPGYFQAMGLRVVRGRGLDAGDREDAVPVAVINETMASRYWPGQEAIGQRFMMGTDDKPWLTVVGVVGQVRHNAVVEPPRAEMYIAHAQLPGHIGSAPRGMALVVQGDGDAAGLASGLRAVVRGLDARLAVGSVRTMDDLAASHLDTARFTAGLLSAFAGLALLLAVVGLYGAVSLVTDERAAEIGVRMALGAERGAILRLVLAEGVVLTAVGAAIGVAASALFARTIEAQLYGVSPHDPAAFVGVPVLFCAVALVASLLPARRAARLDPARGHRAAERRASHWRVKVTAAPRPVVGVTPTSKRCPPMPMVTERPATTPIPAPSSTSLR